MIKKGIIFVSAFSFTMFLTTVLDQQTYASSLNNTKNVSWVIKNDQLDLEKDLNNRTVNFTDRKYSDSYIVGNGDTVKSILRKSQIDSSDINQFVYKTKDADKFFNLKLGQEVIVERDQNNYLVRFIINNGNFSVLQAKKSKDGSFAISEAEKDYKLVKRYVAGQINSSLSHSAKKVGLSSVQVNQLTNIFAWDIDFKYDIKKGDTFSAVFEQKVVDDKVVGTGDIVAAEFILSGKKYTAYLNEDLKGNKKYYNESGASLQKAFLRNPIDFARVSSTFSNQRVHPIFKKVRAHKGTDYAAQIGTPIKTTGDGVVEFIGTQNGYGNVIVVDHGRGYSTLYAHMKGFKKGLKKGSKINQGEIVGYVGMTGYSTGPHLHYEFKINGIAQNSLTVDLPTAEPLNKTQMLAFKNNVKTIAMNMDMVKGATIKPNQSHLAMASSSEDFE